MKPGGGAKTVSRCDIQQVCSAGVPGQQPARLGHGQLRAAELADLGALDPAAERERERLHAVADAQHRDPELEQRRVQPRRAVGVTDAGPPERISPLGLRRATSSAPTWWGSSSEKTPHSRTRRAISCEYWPP